MGFNFEDGPKLFSEKELEQRALVNYNVMLKGNWTCEQLAHLKRRILQKREELTRNFREIQNALDDSFLELQAVGQFLQRLKDA